MERTGKEVVVEEASFGVRLVTLNLPDVRNAMTEEMTETWREVMAEIHEDKQVRAVVLTGKGSSFCSGADLSFLDQGSAHHNTPDRLRDKMVPFYDAWLMARRLPVPVIAAVNGPAIGAGLCLALACDLRYAGQDAVFSAPFNFLGTHGGMGVNYLLPEVVGMARAREMLYTSRRVDAEEALHWGLVSDVADDVLAHSLDVADRIAQAAPIATRLTKVALEQSVHGLDATLRWEALAQPVTMATEDLHEGIQARRQRREARFEGR
ncbi:enoyl-CoA hydratase/isomerase family protein [Streptomyces sp. NPDC059373]